MDKHYTYLLINFFTIIFPLLLSFDKKVHFVSKWKHIFPGLFLIGLFFVLWDYLFTLYDVWSFNANYVIGVWVLNLPLEEILFFVTVPFSCLFIYECLLCYLNPRFLKSKAHGVTLTLLIFSLVMVVLHWQKVYTLVTFTLLSVSSLLLLKWANDKLAKFYLAFLITLIPFYIVNGLLTSIPVVLYNDAENLGIRIGTIPFEDHFYSLALLLLNVLFFEYLRGKAVANVTA